MRLLPALAALLLACLPAQAMPPPERLAALARGLNVTHWLRFPPSRAEADIVNYLRDSDLKALKDSGFTFIRLPVDPALVALPDGRLRPEALRQVEAIVRRITAAGLAVMVEPHPVTSTGFDSSQAARQSVFAFWQSLAPVLARFPPEKVFLELLSEPIFRGKEAEWYAMQERLAAELRAAAPRHTLVGSGTSWSAIDGLLPLAPLADANVIYTIHFYWPMAFTHQGADWASPVFRDLRGLPWPAAPTAACQAALPPQASPQATQVAAWYCREAFDADRLVREVARARAWADQHQAAVVVGEFGGGCFVRDRAARLRWVRDARLAFEANRFGWAMWGLDNCQGFGADSRTRDFTLAPDMLAALGLGRR